MTEADRPRVLALIASNEPSERIRRNLETQTLPPTKILLADRTFKDKFVGTRVTRALNEAISSVDLGAFDWIMRVDCDVILPDRWIERSVGSGADVVGRAGYAMLIRMSAFRRLDSGRFPFITKEDSFIVLKLQSLGYRAVPHVVPIGFVREPARGSETSVYHGFFSGVFAYKLGYEPLHAVGGFISAAKKRRNLLFLISAYGYMASVLARPRKWDEDEASWVFRHQVKQLAKVLRRRAGRT